MLFRCCLCSFPVLYGEAQAGMEAQRSDAWDVVVKVLEQFYEVRLQRACACSMMDHLYVERNWRPLSVIKLTAIRTV